MCRSRRWGSGGGGRESHRPVQATERSERRGSGWRRGNGQSGRLQCEAADATAFHAFMCAGSLCRVGDCVRQRSWPAALRGERIAHADGYGKAAEAKRWELCAEAVVRPGLEGAPQPLKAALASPHFQPKKRRNIPAFGPARSKCRVSARAAQKPGNAPRPKAGAACAGYSYSFPQIDSQTLGTTFFLRRTGPAVVDNLARPAGAARLALCSPPSLPFFFAGSSTCSRA